MIYLRKMLPCRRYKRQSLQGEEVFGIDINRGICDQWLSPCFEISGRIMRHGLLSRFMYQSDAEVSFWCIIRPDDGKFEKFLVNIPNILFILVLKISIPR